MRRIALIGAFVVGGMLIVRTFHVHERVMALCEDMFERMPDTFPPKRMMSGIEDVRVKTARILDLIEAHTEMGDESASEVQPHHAA